MPTSDKNKDGGHSHPQKSGQNHDEQGTARKSSAHDAPRSDKAEGQPKESFGSSGAKDSH